MNNINSANHPRLKLGAQLYLRDGRLFDGSTVVDLSGATPSARYQSAIGYARGAVSQYIMEQEENEQKSEAKRAARSKADADASPHKKTDQ